MTNRLARFTEYARSNLKEKFSSLMRLIIDPTDLHDSFSRQDGRKAPGTDAIKKEDYAQGVEERLKDLSDSTAPTWISAKACSQGVHTQSERRLKAVRYTML